MKFGLSDSMIDSIGSVFAKHPHVEVVLVYGSRAKGNYKEGSDIDLTIEGEISESELSKICMELEELNTPYFFDVSILKKLKSIELIEHINRVGIVFYKKT